MTYIVTFSVLSTTQSYEMLISEIKSSNEWAKLNQQCYLVMSNEKASELRDRLRKHLLVGEQLFVAKILAPAAWTGASKELTEWIKKALR